MKSLVSVIIPVLNRAHCIEETLRSVMNQTYKHWECIVIDDGSTDGTQAVIEKMTNLDDRITLIQRSSKKVKGANSCRNIGFEKSKGDYIQWLDSDDIISPNKVEIQLEAIENKVDSISTCTWGIYVDGNVKIHANLESYSSYNETKQFLNGLRLSKGYFPIHAYLMHRVLVVQAGLWDEKLHINQDGEFMSRIFLHVKSYVFCELAQAIYRMSNTASVSTYSSIGKATQAIIVWKIIAQRLERINKKYVDTMKMKLYTLICQSYPELIQKEQFFFRLQLREQKKRKSLLYRILKKIN